MTLLSLSPRALHRKFIVTILALSVAITGLNATPARADSEDIAKILAGVAVLGIIGAAINDRKHDNRDHPHVDPIPEPHPYPRPLPPRVRRYDLPSQCLTTVRSNGRDRNLVGMHCLRNNYRYVNELPRRCYMELDTRYNTKRGYRAGYRPECLREHGYRLVRR